MTIAQRAAALLACGLSLTAREVARELSVTPIACRAVLARLSERGVLVRDNAHFPARFFHVRWRRAS